MPILNYTTSIDSFKTIGEIQQILARHKVVRCTVEYNQASQPIALTFGYNLWAKEFHFRLPCNFKGIQKALEKKRVAPKLRTEEQAIRVGWRILKDWIEAQMALSEAEMATPLEVFLPYALTQDGTTVYEVATKSNTLLLNS